MSNNKTDMQHTKHPRLFIDHDIDAGKPLPLDTGQVHYLKNVLRRGIGDPVRVFNGRNGEWLCTIEGLQKQGGVCTAQDQLIAQPPAPAALHLYFVPIKKQRMDFLVEKAVELGVTDLHPIFSAHGETRKIKEERMHAHIIEAAEQCERLDLPRLHTPVPLQQIKSNVPLYACIERLETSGLDTVKAPEPCGFIIGPEGGFTSEECQWMAEQASMTPVSLGNKVLRAETAALSCLAYITQKRMD